MRELRAVVAAALERHYELRGARGLSGESRASRELRVAVEQDYPGITR